MDNISIDGSEMIAARERLGGTAETGYTLGIIGAARHGVT